MHGGSLNVQHRTKPPDAIRIVLSISQSNLSWVMMSSHENRTPSFRYDKDDNIPVFPDFQYAWL